MQVSRKLRAPQCHVHLLHRKEGKDLADLGCVNDRQDKASFQRWEPVGRAGKVIPLKQAFAILFFTAPIMRAEKEQNVCSAGLSQMTKDQIIWVLLRCLFVKRSS